MIRCLLIVFLLSGISAGQDAAKPLPDVADGDAPDSVSGLGFLRRDAVHPSRSNRR